MAKRILNLFFGLFLALSLAADGGYKPVKRYDPSRDAVADIDAAAAEAARSGWTVFTVFTVRIVMRVLLSNDWVINNAY